MPKQAFETEARAMYNISQLILLLPFEKYYLEALPFYAQVHRDHMQCFSLPWNSNAALQNEQNDEWICKSR